MAELALCLGMGEGIQVLCSEQGIQTGWSQSQLCLGEHHQPQRIPGALFQLSQDTDLDKIINVQIHSPASLPVMHGERSLNTIPSPLNNPLSPLLPPRCT